MSAPTFGEHALRLTGYGFDVIPITRITDRVRSPGKQPAQRFGWQNGCLEAHWKAYADCGVGVLTKLTPALDIDVLDAALAGQISALATAKLGDAPIRTGQPPKRLMPFRLDGEPFDKIKVSWWGVAHERHTRDRPPAVEILANGQQFVALGIHPGTGQPYTWDRDPLLEIPHALLPGLSYEKAVRFMRALAGALERIGATDIKLTGIRKPETVGVAEAVGRRRQGGVHPAAELLRKIGSRVEYGPAEAERIRDALDRTTRFNPDDYGDWIKVGLAVKAALPGDDGFALWCEWSARSSKYNRAIAREKWATFTPEHVTAATIFWGAGR